MKVSDYNFWSNLRIFLLLKQFFVIGLLIAASASISDGREWDMCELAITMKAHGFPRSQMEDWMCLVKYGSNYEQTATNLYNRDGSTDWGLFQINDRYWCKNSEKKRKNFGTKYKKFIFQLKKAIAMIKIFVA